MSDSRKHLDVRSFCLIGLLEPHIDWLHPVSESIAPSFTPTPFLCALSFLWFVGCAIASSSSSFERRTERRAEGPVLLCSECSGSSSSGCRLSSPVFETRGGLVSRFSIAPSFHSSSEVRVGSFSKLGLVMFPFPKSYAYKMNINMLNLGLSW